MAKKRKIIDPEIKQAKKVTQEVIPYYDPNKGLSPNLDFLNEPPHQFPPVVDLLKKEDI